MLILMLTMYINNTLTDQTVTSDLNYYNVYGKKDYYKDP